jgi:hypothetical protein
MAAKKVRNNAMTETGSMVALMTIVRTIAQDIALELRRSFVRIKQRQLTSVQGDVVFQLMDVIMMGGNVSYPLLPLHVL